MSAGRGIVICAAVFVLLAVAEIAWWSHGRDDTSCIAGYTADFLAGCTRAVADRSAWLNVSEYGLKD